MRSLIRRRPEPATEPTPPVYSQTELRQRRRKWLRVDYTGSFDLAAEVHDILGPLAIDAAQLPRPLALRPDIDTVTEAVHELLSCVIGMLAESRYLDSGARSRTARGVRDLAQRPTEPQISDEQLIAGTWAAVLVGHIAPHSGDFAAYLGRALPTNHPRLTSPSASERLTDTLRLLDQAAADLQRRIPKAAARQALPSLAEFNAANRARREHQRAQAALSKIRSGAPTP